MVPITRRRALQGAAGLLVGLAGCPGATRDDTHESPTPSARPRGLENVETDPEHAVLRASAESPLAWFTRDARADTTVERDRAERDGLIANESTAATLSFADVAGAADARAFVEATDFGQETVYLQHRGVPACYRYELCYVSWNHHEVETRYGQFLRDHDVACEADARDSQAVLVRIPDALDPDEVTGSGSGVRNGACFQAPGERGRGTSTPAPDDASPDGGTER